VAFVNKQSGDEAQQERAASGEPFDFDPNDPDVVKVHYDVSGWNLDQRAELSEALAEAELPHVWEGDEVIVPEVVEADVDVLFDQLDTILGPFAIVLDDDAESTEFGLDEWSDADRTVLTEALIASEVPHRWAAPPWWSPPTPSTRSMICSTRSRPANCSAMPAAPRLRRRRAR